MCWSSRGYTGCVIPRLCKLLRQQVLVGSRELSGAQTTGEAFAGSAKYYVDWVRGKCVQDCDGDAPCGGLAPSWITVRHDSVETCCSSHLYWVCHHRRIAAEEYELRTSTIGIGWPKRIALLLRPSCYEGLVY